MSVLARVRGTIEEKTADSVILFAGGLGLEIQVPLSTANALPAPGEEATLRTHLHLREGALGLYGFSTAGEQRMFELLLTVTGVGPRAALNCLSLLSVEQIGTAIARGDGEILRRVPLVGRKTADRILLELKTRVQDFSAEGPHLVAAVDDEAIEALMFYGYSAAEAAAAIATLPRDRELSIEERTMLALRYFAPQAEQRGRRS
jgi:Holliday junction DNA helicase RuvA